MGNRDKIVVGDFVKLKGDDDRTWIVRMESTVYPYQKGKQRFQAFDIETMGDFKVVHVDSVERA